MATGNIWQGIRSHQWLSRHAMVFTGGLKFIEIYCLLGFVLMATVFAEYDILVKFDSNLLV